MFEDYLKIDLGKIKLLQVFVKIASDWTKATIQVMLGTMMI